MNRCYEKVSLSKLIFCASFVFPKEMIIKEMSQSLLNHFNLLQPAREVAVF